MDQFAFKTAARSEADGSGAKPYVPPYRPIDPFDLIWDLEGGTSSTDGACGEPGVDPFDLIWDLETGTSSDPPPKPSSPTDGASREPEIDRFDLIHDVDTGTTAVADDWMVIG
jgi:hypothetical protein